MERYRKPILYDKLIIYNAIYRADLSSKCTTNWNEIETWILHCKNHIECWRFHKCIEELYFTHIFTEHIAISFIGYRICQFINIVDGLLTIGNEHNSLGLMITWCNSKLSLRQTEQPKNWSLLFWNCTGLNSI